MVKKILVLGAGVAGAQLIKHLHHKFHHRKDFSIRVIDRNNYTAFIPMLHEVATGSVSPKDISHPIREIIHCCLESFYQADVKSIDLNKKLVKTSGEEFSYDYLIVALGSTDNFYGIPGAEKYSHVLKTMTDAAKLRSHLIDTFEEASKMPRDAKRAKGLHFVVVGGGYTGVETAGQMADLFNKEFKKLYPEIYPDEQQITLIQRGDRILPIISKESSEKAGGRLEKLGVRLMLGHRVSQVSSTGVTLDNGDFIETQHVIWASGVMANGNGILPKEMLERGRVKVNRSLQVFEHPEVFVLGDMAAAQRSGGPHPQTAQAAFQQSKSVAQNLHRMINDLPLETFAYNHKGDLVPIGNHWAVAEIGPLKFSGFIAWWLRRTVYLQGIFSWGDRIRVIFNWTMNLFSKRDTSKL